MSITYHFVDQLPPQIVTTDTGEIFDTGEATCNIYITRSFLTKVKSPIFKVLGSIGICYGQWQLGFPTNNLDNDYSFVNGWLRLYNERCHQRLQPLGYPGAHDGTCDQIPRFEEAL